MNRCLIFILLFFAGLLKAEAAPPACTGNDLIEEMRVNQPDLYRSLRAEADAIPNARHLLWRIEAPGLAKPSWLFGTVHLTDPRVHDLPPPVAQALDDASAIVIESTEAVNTAEMAKHMFSVASLMVLPDGMTLDEVIPAADLAMVKAYFDKSGKGFEVIIRFRPYMAALALAFPKCEAARQQAGLEALDAKIAGTAKRTGAQLIGLETLADQFGSMASMPMDEQVEWLVQSVEFAPQIDDMTETMVRLYLARDTGLLLAWSRQMAVDTGTEQAWKSFKKLLIDARNLRMADRAIPIIDKGGAFIAVGALHLPGETGLVQLLRDRGYIVTPVH